MKKLVFIVMVLFTFNNVVNAQAPAKKVNDKTYQEVSSKESSYIETDMVYIDKNNQKYTIYKHTFSRGERKGQIGYFIKKVSKKSGKSYWKEVKIN